MVHIYENKKGEISEVNLSNVNLVKMYNAVTTKLLKLRLRIKTKSKLNINSCRRLFIVEGEKLNLHHRRDTEHNSSISK